MDPFGERLRREIATWVDEGLLSEQQAERILERQATRPGPRDDAGWASDLLHAAAGVLIGAAALALVLVGLEPIHPQRLLFVIGLVFAATGAAIILRVPSRALVGDAFLVASMVTLAPSGIEGHLLFMGVGAAALFVAYIVWRHGTVFVQALATLAFTVVVALVVHKQEAIEPGQLQFAAQIGLLTVLVVVDKALRSEEAILPVAIGVVMLAQSALRFFSDQTVDALDLIVFVGILMIVLAGIGLWWHHRGLVTGAIVVLSIDAIAFGFEVGDVIAGIVTLLILAAILLWQGGKVRQYLKD